MNIAVLLTCHNRKKSTLKCLQKIYSQNLSPKHTYEIFLVDDGSTDGTKEDVRKYFPDVHLLKGTGKLFWNKGMRLAWQKARCHFSYDAYLWLNDDTFMSENAMQTLILDLENQKRKCTAEGIVVGTCWQKSSKSTVKVPTYGGYKEGQLVQPQGNPVEVDWFNGNLVLVSRRAFLKLGNLSTDYTHCYGDTDYGLRARRANIPVWVSGDYTAFCVRGNAPIWRNKQYSLIERLKHFLGPKGVSIKEIRAICKARNKRFWPLVYGRKLFRLIFPLSD